MAKVFISYSRKDIDFAKQLTGELHKSELDFWIDWEGIPPTVEWWREIEKGIEESDAFLFLISPDSANSKVCQQEIDHAVKNGKRLIPLLIRDAKANEIHPKLTTLNWIYFRQKDDFDASLTILLSGIHTDFDWVEVQRRLQVKALEWERNHNEKSFLLRGKDLQAAEQQLAINSSKEPHPTNLQRAYVFESRKAADRQRRTLATVSIFGIIILTALSIFSFIQRNAAIANEKSRATAQADAENQRETAVANEQEAMRQAKIALARQLAAQSSALKDTNFRVSLLLGVEAFNFSDDLQTRGNILDIVNAKPPLRQIFTGHTGDTADVAFSPNGKIIASAGWDGQIGLWDVYTGKQFGGFLQGHEGWIYGVAFSPDGRMLASAGSDGAIMLWDVNSGKRVGAPIWDYGDAVMSVAFSPDGKTLAAAGYLDRIIFLDVETRQPIDPPIRGHTAFITSVVFSPDGQMLASGSYDGTIILWDVETHRQIGQLTGHQSWVFSLAFSPDGNTLVSGGNDDTFILWDVGTLQVIDQPVKVSGRVDGVDFSPDGSLLAIGSGASLILWDMVTGEMIGQPLTGHAYLIREVAFSPDGSHIVTAGGTDGTIVLWETQSPLQSSTTNGIVAFSPDDKTLASINENVISLWDTTDYKKVHSLIGHSDWVNAIAFSPDGKTIVSGGYDNTIILWDVNTGNSIGRLRGHVAEISSLAFNPDGKILASGSGDNTIILWDMETLQPIGPPMTGHSAFITSVVFSPNGNILASSGWDSAIILWDMGTRNIIGQPILAHFVTSLAFSPDGSILASGSYDSLITLWDAATHQPMGSPLEGHSDYVHAVAFSPDGKLLASGSLDKSIILWDMDTRKPIGQPLDGMGTIYSVAFSPDGRTLAAGSSGSTTIWNLDSESWTQAACQRAGGNLTQVEWERYFPDEEYRKTCEQWPLPPVAIPATPAASP